MENLGMKDDSNIEATYRKEAILDDLYRNSMGEPTIFGNRLGIATGLDALGVFEMGVKKIPQDKIEDYLRGFASGVAYSDLGTSGFEILRREEVKDAFNRQVDLAYRYLRGIVVFKGLLKE